MSSLIDDWPSHINTTKARAAPGNVLPPDVTPPPPVWDDVEDVGNDEDSAGWGGM